MSEYGTPPPPPPPPPSYQPSSGGGGAGAGTEAAGMGRRFGARLIDGLLLGVVNGVLFATVFAGAAGSGALDENGQLTTDAQRGFFASFLLLFAVTGLLTLLYEVVLIALKGATLGKMAVKIKVVRASDGAVPGWGPSIIRWLIPLVGGLFCGIGQIVVYLSPFFDNSGRQQGWHDKAAGTVVVKAG